VGHRCSEDVAHKEEEKEEEEHDIPLQQEEEKKKEMEDDCFPPLVGHQPSLLMDDEWQIHRYIRELLRPPPSLSS